MTLLPNIFINPVNQLQDQQDGTHLRRCSLQPHLQEHENTVEVPTQPR